MQLCLDHILYHYLKEFHNSETIFGVVSRFMKKWSQNLIYSNREKYLFSQQYVCLFLIEGIFI